jgi:hypothetical protein
MCDRGIYFSSVLEFLRLDFGTALTVGYVLILTVRYVLTVGYVLILTVRYVLTGLAVVFACE